MKKETLKITRKYIRWAGQGRTPVTYCTYIAENENHKHKLKTIVGTELFEILRRTVCSKLEKYEYSVFIDGIYENDKLISITNFRRI